MRALVIHEDDRGTVRETYRASWFPDVPPVVQLVRSESRAGVLRGMHMHRVQWDIWHFVSGSAQVRLNDHHGDDRAFFADAGTTIAIPPGTSHGFWTPFGCVLLYALTQEYDGSDEFGWFPFDAAPDGWPGEQEGLIVSQRDLTAPSLADFRP